MSSYVKNPAVMGTSGHAKKGLSGIKHFYLVQRSYRGIYAKRKENIYGDPIRYKE